MEEIVFDRVGKRYGSKEALSELTLSIKGGQVTALLGPNGAGKTTAVSLLLGLLQPTRGKIRYDNWTAGDRRLKHKIGAMLQESPIADGLSVRETLQLFRSYYRHPLSLERLLHISGLDAEAGRRASTLSGGQKRRLAFAVAMAGDPEIIVLDEPTTGMDVESRVRFWDVIKTFAARGKTIILTTHYLEEADAVADRIAVIADGRLVADGSPNELKSSMPLRTITFSIMNGTHSHVDTEEILRALPGISEVRLSGNQVQLQTEDSDQLLPHLLQAGIPFTDIQIHAASLETVFQQLTNQRQREILK